MKVSELERRISQLGKASNNNLPDWFPPTATREEQATWIAIQKSYKRFARIEREREFTRELRLKYPDMKYGFSEMLDDGVRELENDPKLRRAEGLDDDSSPETMDPQVLQEYARNRSRELFRKHHQNLTE